MPRPLQRVDERPLGHLKGEEERWVITPEARMNQWHRMRKTRETDSIKGLCIPGSSAGLCYLYLCVGSIPGEVGERLVVTCHDPVSLKNKKKTAGYKCTRSVNEDDWILLGEFKKLILYLRSKINYRLMII